MYKVILTNYEAINAEFRDMIFNLACHQVAMYALYTLAAADVDQV